MDKKKRMKKKCAARAVRRAVLPVLAAVFLIAAAAGMHTEAQAQMGIASTTNYNDLPVNHVKVEKLAMDKAQFSSTNSSIIMTSNWQIADSAGGTTTKAIMYNGEVSWGTSNATQTANAKMTKNTVSGSFTLRWKDAATLPDGTKADVVYTFSGWEFNLGERPDDVASNAKVNVPILTGSTSVSYATYNPRRGVANTTGVATTIKQSIKTTVKIVKTGTDTAVDSKYSSLMVRFLDLDVIDHSLAHDKTAAERYAGSYSEGIALVSGWRSPIYRTADTSTTMETVDGNQKIRGTRAADGTISSGFIGSASPQGYSYIWYGSYTASGAETGLSMATGLSIGPEVSVLASAGKGGSIEKPGATNYILNATTTYDYTPARGYKVRSLTVNGSGVSFSEGGGTYTFAKLIERSSSYDHTIDVQFKGPSVSYRWEGEHPDVKVPGGGEVTPGDYDVDGTYSKGDEIRDTDVTIGETTYPKGKWIFEGWDKEGTIEVWEDTVITGRWTFRPEWDITTEVVNGTIEGAEENVPDGESRTVKYKADEGFQLKELVVDGNEEDVVLNPEGYTFEKVTKDHHVKAVFEKIPDLEIIKKADRRHYNAGDTVTYTVTVRQTVTGAEARGVVVTDSIPEGLSLIEGSISGSGVTVEEESEHAYKVSIESIASDERRGIPGEAVYTYKCKAAEDVDAHDLVNTVTAGGDNVPGQVTDKETVDAHVPHVTIEKTVDKEKARPGDTLKYTVSVRQDHEGAELRNVVFIDTLPDGITIDEASVILTRLAGDDAVYDEADAAADEGEAAQDEAGEEAGTGTGEESGTETGDEAGAEADGSGSGGGSGDNDDAATADEVAGDSAAEDEDVTGNESADETASDGSASGEGGAAEEASGEDTEAAEETGEEAGGSDGGEPGASDETEAGDEDGSGEEPGPDDSETADGSEGTGEADAAEGEADTETGGETAYPKPKVTIKEGKIIIESAVMKKGFDVTFEAVVNDDTEGEVVNLASVDGYITDEQKLPEPLEDTAVTLVEVPKEEPPAAVEQKPAPEPEKAEPKPVQREEKEKPKASKVRTGDESFPAAAVIVMAAAFVIAATTLLSMRRRGSRRKLNGGRK